MNFCACGQEARILEDREKNGQVSRFCGICGNTPHPRNPPALDVEVPRSLESVELDLRIRNISLGWVRAAMYKV